MIAKDAMVFSSAVRSIEIKELKVLILLAAEANNWQR